MKTHSLVVGILAAILGLAGCAAKGEVVTLDLRATAPSEGIQESTQGPTVVVAGFEDTRAEKERLGIRHHLWGGESYFKVSGGKPGEAIAQVAADHLKAKGWRAEMAKDGAMLGDVTLSGRLVDLSVDAESKWFRTIITAKARVQIEGVNRADGSVVRMTVNGEGDQTEFWYDVEDSEGLLDDVLASSLDKFVANTKFENGMLRLK